MLYQKICCICTSKQVPRQFFFCWMRQWWTFHLHICHAHPTGRHIYARPLIVHILWCYKAAISMWRINTQPKYYLGNMQECCSSLTAAVMLPIYIYIHCKNIWVTSTIFWLSQLHVVPDMCMTHYKFHGWLPISFWIWV